MQSVPSTAAPAQGAEISVRCPAGGPLLLFPVGGREDDVRRLEIWCDGEHYTELLVPQGEMLYEAAIPLPACREIGLGGDCPDAFYRAAHFSDTDPSAPDAGLPLVHYAPAHGWCNDPNGLVYADGTFLFYYQYNPCGTSWNNMSWGAAATADFVHWERRGTVLLPDAAGSMFSGCAIRNERGLLGLPKNALLYFYTAAGQAYACGDKAALWSAGRPFTQNWAYSLDGGRTLRRPAQNVLIGDLHCEARDPKVFWYEPRGWYCMVLFLDGNRFEVRHSRDLLTWEKTQELTLAGSWECPDLFALRAPDGSERWVFWSADGYYYIGSFDGERFHTDCTRHLAYRTALPYAAQTWSGTSGRVISIPWLRTKNTGRSFTGMYGVPRSFSLVPGPDGPLLRQCIAEEFAACLRPTGTLKAGQSLSFSCEQALLLQTECAQPSELRWEVFGSRVGYNPVSGLLSVDEKSAYFAPGLTDFALLADRGILECTAAHDTLYAAFETGCTALRGSIRFCACAGAVTRLYGVGPTA